MKRGTMILAGIIAIATISTFAAEPNQPSEPLFNGRDLTGWEVVGKADFAVTNQNLHLVGGMGWLKSKEAYSDFILELEWRALESGYDSGIFIRAGTNGVPWPDDAWQVNLARTSLGGLVKGRRTMVPAETPPMPLHTWVKFRIGVQGSKIWLEVDGERAWDYDNLDAAQGFIGIQAEGKSFEFRNIRIVTKPEAK